VNELERFKELRDLLSCELQDDEAEWVNEIPSNYLALIEQAVKLAVTQASNKYLIGVTGVELRSIGDKLIVSVSTPDNPRVDIIEEYCPDAPPMGHHVTGLGIKDKYNKS
jgi:hypothetical protein